MKLSAPPPPPPEPPDQPEPTPPGDPQPEGTGGEPITSSETPESSTPTPPQPQPATWPSWFPQADVALVVLAIAFGFLVSSFTARNAEIWLHLAAGKRLVSGEYTPGTDPFSFSGADRPWVNHSWLWDLGAYLLYTESGTMLVVAKALAVALAGAFLIAIRRPGFPLWPWAALTFLAFLASATRLTLHPIVGSVVLLAATLFVLFRVPHRPASWRTPLIIGGIFWLWANVDSWFVLGPFAVALILLGEYLQARVLNRPEPETPEAEPLGSLPDLRTLWLTLGLGVAACMANPHHIRVWELPFELVGSEIIRPDSTMNIVLNLAPTDDVFSRNEYLGKNLNGLAYAVMLIGGGALLGLGAGKLRVSHLVLWIGFALISLITVFAIPFFAVVAVPLVAAQFNAMSGRVALGNKSDRRTRLVLLGSGGGRALSLIAVLLACACAWPGWMQPEVLDNRNPRRVAWSVEADTGLVQAAQQLQSWRESGELPNDVRGMIASITLSDYCAWFAPNEKVYINSRFNHHREELPDYVALRGAVWVFVRPDEPSDQRAAAAVLRARGLSYLALYDSRRQIAPYLDSNVPTLRRMGGPSLAPTIWDILGPNDWVTWYQDGRTVMFGWRPGFPEKSPLCQRLQVDPVMLAFGPKVKRLPAGVVGLPPTPRTWMDEFVTPARPTSPTADEALGWYEYKQELGRNLTIRHIATDELLPNGPVVPEKFSFHHAAIQTAMRTGHLSPLRPFDIQDAIPILTLRAARRAIAANPDHPDGYFALALAVGDLDLPITDGERIVWQITALRQCLDRMPPPGEYRPGVYASSPTLAASRLAHLYIDPLQKKQLTGIPLFLRPMPQGVLFDLLGLIVPTRPGEAVVVPFLPIDLAHAAQQLAVDYAKREFVGLLGNSEKLYQGIVQGQDDFLKMLDREVRGRFDSYTERTRDRPFGVKERLNLALQHGLVGEAIRLIRETPDLEKEFGPGAPAVALQRIALELFAGRIEEATADLAAIRGEFEKADAGDPKLTELRAKLRLLDYHQSVMAGDYGAAGKHLEDMLAEAVARRPTFPTPAEIPSHTRPYIGSLPPAGIETIVWFVGQEFVNFRVAEGTIFSRLEFEATFFNLRGFLSLVEGDIGSAKERFQQTVRDAPAAWADSKLKVVNTRALGYLHLIQLAEERAAKK